MKSPETTDLVAHALVERLSESEEIELRASLQREPWESDALNAAWGLSQDANAQPGDDVLIANAMDQVVERLAVRAIQKPRVPISQPTTSPTTESSNHPTEVSSPSDGNGLDPFVVPLYPMRWLRTLGLVAATVLVSVVASATWVQWRGLREGKSTSVAKPTDSATTPQLRPPSHPPSPKAEPDPPAPEEPPTPRTAPDLQRPDWSPRDDAPVPSLPPPPARSSVGASPPTAAFALPGESSQSASSPRGSGQAPAGSPLTAAELFERANAARLDGDTRTAMRLYSQLLHRYPASQEAHVARLTIGKLRLEQGDAVGAETALKQHLNGGESTTQIEALYGLARALDAQGRPAEAEAILRELLRRYPGSPYEAAARARLKNGP